MTDPDSIDDMRERILARIRLLRVELERTAIVELMAAEIEGSINLDDASEPI